MPFNILKTLKSPKFTIVLVICLTVVFLMGVIVPQKNLLGDEAYIAWKQRNTGLVTFLEKIQFTSVHRSPVTLVLWVLFFLNLVLIMSGRIPSIWRRCFQAPPLPSGMESLKSGRLYEAIPTEEQVDTIGSVFKKRHFHFFSEGNAFRAVKNRLSPLATILFHLSFFLLLLGGIVTFYTQFRGTVRLAVGETFIGQYDGIKKPIIGEIPWTKFTVEEIRPTFYQRSVPVKLDVALRTEKGVKRIGINSPYDVGPLSFVVKTIDVAPLFVLKDDRGNDLDGAYVKLKGFGEKGDAFRMKGFEFRTIFYTDYLAGSSPKQSGRAALPQALSQSPMTGQDKQPMEIVNPAFGISVFKDGKNLLTSRIVRPGEFIDFDGYRLLFPDLTYWVEFYVVKEHGIPVVYSGFALMLVALTIRFFFYRRDIRGIIEGGRVHLSGSGEFFPSLFADEFRSIVDDLKAGAKR